MSQVALTVACVLVLTSCGGGGGSSSSPAVPPVPTSPPAGTPTTTPGTNAAAYVCPTSASSSSSSGSAGVVRRPAAATGSTAAANGTLLAVSYAPGAGRTSAATGTREPGGLQHVQTLTFAQGTKLVDVVAVPGGQLAAAAAALRSQAGVESVAPVGRRHLDAITTPFFTNDPYFQGFSSSQNTIAGNANAPATFHVGPYEEAGGVPGQWDMHAIGLESAFGYAKPGNGSGITNGNAVGSSNVRIAIIDTGSDPNHPELSSKIVHQRCFITNPSGTQSTGSFASDPQGHGTDVAGIAGAATNNNFGYAGAGGLADVLAYRVFPTPNDNCSNASTTDPQCLVGTNDIAAAIEDAIAQHANVINLSFGGDACTTPGVDPDALERAAIADALAAKIVVVAASGNGGKSALEAPACVNGVIAVGASALGDGTQNGSGTAVGNPGAPVEYVTSYTNVGAPGAQAKSGSAWGLVAPGGDPLSAGDSDQLHWIENIWTSTPYDRNFAGNCVDDYPVASLSVPPVDCRVLIAGTSMAAPHVAGAAALILAVNPSYQSSSAMKQLFCETADDIGDPREGCGRLNLYRAMAKALGDPQLP